MKLNAEEEKKFLSSARAVARKEKKKVMEIVTSWMEQGIKIGRRQGEQTIILRQLNRRLSAVGVRLQSRIRRLPVEKLEALADVLFDFKETDDLKR
ncbi:MAG: DUF4351 domain-containing protein [Acidobacteriota bacterium]